MNRKQVGQREVSSPAVDDEQLARVVNELAERLCEGERLDWPACLKEYPDEAAQLQELAPAIEILAMFKKGEASST
jgi:hypothetical protein